MSRVDGPKCVQNRDFILVGPCPVMAVRYFEGFEWMQIVVVTGEGATPPTTSVDCCICRTGFAAEAWSSILEAVADLVIYN
jgi:hypothetical protein